MKNILTLLALCLSLTINAQLSAKVAREHGLRLYGESDCMNNYWCLYDAEPVYVADKTTFGLKNMIEEWADLSVKLRESYGEPRVLTQDVKYPSYVDGVQDYENLNMAALAGSAWIEFYRAYDTPAGTIIVVLVVNSDVYMVSIVSTPRP